ncbi:unnamed protein product, partial [Prorocentrum cordatum]
DLDIAECNALALHNIEMTIKTANRSEPGPDDLPYAAWANKRGINLLHDVVHDLLYGFLPSTHFSASILAPISKIDEPTDGILTRRKAAQLRPRRFKNADAVIIAASCRRKIHATVAQNAQLFRRELLEGRAAPGQPRAARRGGRGKEPAGK